MISGGTWRNLLNCSLPNFQLKSLSISTMPSFMFSSTVRMFSRVDLDLGARGRKLPLALLLIGDVAGGADHAGRMSVGSALRDAALARPSPRVVVGEVAVLDKQTRGDALEVIDDRLAVLLEVVAMDAAAGFRRRQRHVVRHAENRAQQRRVIDRAC